MFDRTVEPDPRPAAPQSRAIYRMRDGHRREYAASRDRGSISFPERCARGLADIGVYGAVPYRDLAEARFGGHPYTTRRAVNAWVRDGLVTRDPGHRTRGQPVQGPDAHPQRRGRGPEAGRRTGNGSRTGNPVRTHPACRSRARHRRLPRLHEGEAAPARPGRSSAAHPARHRTQERRRARERGGAAEGRQAGRRCRTAPHRRRTRTPGRRRRARALPGRPDRVHRCRAGEPDASTSRSRPATTAKGPSRRKRRPGSRYTPTDRPRRGCCARSALAAATTAPRCGDPPTAIRPQSNSDYGRSPPCNPGKSAPASPPPSRGLPCCSPGRASNTSRRIGRSSSPNTASCSPCTWRSHSQPSRHAIYAVARAAGLADLGRRVDLAERSVRRGEGDPALTDALRRDAEGDWE